MLQVTIDMFSGRPNPAWFVVDDDFVRELLEPLSSTPPLLAEPGTGFDGLGFREVQVTLLDDDRRVKGIPRRFALASTAAEDLAGSGELARRLIESMERFSDLRLPSHEITPLTARIRDLALEQLDRFLDSPPKWRRPKSKPQRANPRITTTVDKQCDCRYEISQYNPAFWNIPAAVSANNCYNYARNWRTDTFAQPGRAHGAQTDVMSCPTVTVAAEADGLVPRCDCLADSEFPRRPMALVVAPGDDYHWYREQREGFRGHKPGHTEARNWDNSGALVTSPESADRGPYSDFCGYFYAGRSVVIS